MGLSKSSVQRGLADNGRHPYHYTRVQHLLPEDYPIRREFCLWLINQNDAPHFLSRILFSDESLFCREGCSNYHNLHIWAEENSRELFPRGFQHRFSVNFTELADLIVPLAYRINDWFQQDGAPPHFSRNVREILDNQYPQRWIGRGGPHHWSAGSPDL
ncbi:unnamed protein product, partial [Tenebrio molitor]